MVGFIRAPPGNFFFMRTKTTSPRIIGSLLFAGAAATAIATAPLTFAQPAPPPCFNADGTPCYTVGTAGPEGATGAIPGGPAGTAGPGGASGSTNPGGVGGTAGPDGVAGCIPNVGCATIPVG